MKGKGTTQVNASELYPGMFIYNFIVDHKLIDSKTMLLTE